MGLTQGDVKITIGVTGKGDTRVVKEAGKDVKDLGEKIGTSMKSSVAPVNKLREGFEQVRSNVGFLLGGAIALGVGIAALANEFSANSQAIKAWSEVQKEAAGAVAETSRLVEEIQIKLGKRQPKSDLEKLGDSLRDTWAHNQELIDKASGAIIAYEDRVEELKHLFGEFAPPTQKALKELAHLHTELNNLTDEQNKALRENIGLINEIKRAAGQGFRADLLGAGGKPFYEQFPAKNGATPPRSFGGNRSPKPAFSFHDIGTAVDRTGAIGIPSEGGPQESPDWIAEMMAPLPTSIDLATEAMGRFAGALSPVLDEMLPGMAGAIGGLVDIMGAFTSEADKSAKAQVAAAASGAVAVAGGIGQILDGKRGMWIAESIAEGGAAAAAFAVGDLWGGGQHLLASAGYAAAAASAGGGGGAKGGGGSRGGAFNRSLSDRTSSGNSSVTINTGVYFAGRSDQETAAELHSMSRRGTGSGFVPRGA